MPSTAAVASPFEDPQAWDVVIVGGKKSPGYCEVTGFQRGNEWDIKKGKGAVGATFTFVQKPPAKGKVKFYFWLQSQADEWVDYRKLLKYDPTKKSIQAIDIYYPSLAEIDVNSVVTENIGATEHEGKGMYSITVEFIEYFPVKAGSGVSSPTGSASGPKTTNPGKSSDPIADAQQAEIAALLKKAGEP